LSESGFTGFAGFTGSSYQNALILIQKIMIQTIGHHPTKSDER
jgi:hypothetical protein